MPVDMSQFLATFYEESFEGLEIMESELLNLDVGAADSETINTIFRAAHSIKGGSATFGLSSVADFTHVMETLLDEMRDGRRQVTQEAVNILLASVDVLREMLKCLREERGLDTVKISETHQQLEQLLKGEAAAVVAKTAMLENSNSTAESVEGWRIVFRPHTDMLKTGNDLVRMFRELALLGDFKVEADIDSVPAMEDIIPEESYLSWVVVVKGNIERKAIEEVFEWVDDECDLVIAPIVSEVTPSAPTTKPASDLATPGLAVDLLETSFNALAPQGEKLVSRFYEELFKRYPQVKPLFAKADIKKQQQKLLSALKLVVSNLRQPAKLKSALVEMGARHQGYGALAEHYPAVAFTLLDVMQEIAGDLWSDQLEQAWRQALDTVAQIMLSGYTKQTTAKAAATPVVKPAVQKAVAASSSSESTSIRVGIEKVDELINMVGELVITQSMLSQFGEAEEFTVAHIEKLRDGLSQLERNTRELQESVMRIRMLPISFAFQRFPRLVHDLSGKLNKKVQIKMSGEQTELDKTVMEKIGDPLVHLVRNSLDHGIETPEKRIAAGKPETGTVHLNAYHQGGNIVIEIIDDGAGLNRDKILKKAIERGIVAPDETLTTEQINELIFRAGFSTADVVSDVSGRGVGMDVVRKNIRSLGGTIEIQSELGIGSTFTIRLPLTLAILDGQLVKVGSETYIVPLVSIIESLQVKGETVNSISGRGEVYKLREEYIPIVRLSDLFGIEALAKNLREGLLVVVEADGKKVAVFVDDLLGQQQVVIKSLESNFKRVDGLSGATILGDGTVALILDVSGLSDLYKRQMVDQHNVVKLRRDDVAA